ncbi:MAG: heme-binding protein [Treponema sp.]|jgi:uncharacterized protein (UPF0303 family)|nr:heme-binding protein [Treponema sp.]
MVKDSPLDKTIEIISKQEELLVFPHFNRQDAWDLGHVFAEIIAGKKVPAPICVRLLSGQIVFQWAGDGTNADNDYWMIRKFRLVRDMDMSSLLNVAWFKKKGETLESRGLDPNRYAAAGGGFPIRIKGSGLFAVAAVSGLPQVEDHALLVEGIGKYLNVTGVPQLPKITGI